MWGSCVGGTAQRGVNKKWKDKKYKDLKAAAEARGSKDGFKKPLTASLFVHTFECGADRDSYWNYNHMVLQLEDCVDVIMPLYPEYEHLFQFDHSSGHNKQREDGLNIKKWQEVTLECSEKWEIQ